MKTLESILRKISALQVEADRLRNLERAGVIERIKVAIAIYGITQEELGYARTKTSTDDNTEQPAKPPVKTPNSKSQLQPKFRNPNDSHQWWSGRGHQPQWMKDHLANGGKKDDLLIHLS